MKTTLTAKQEDALIWRHTHRDFRGVINDTKYILVNRGAEGTCSVALSALTPDERAAELAVALRREEKRLASK